MRCLRIALPLLLGLTAWPAVACYTVYDASNRIVYQSDKPPVDMSLPLHETLPARFPGGHLVFEEGTECSPVSSVAIGNGGRTGTTSPLLTDERSARAMNLPHRTLGNGIAVVPPRSAVMGPGVTVVPSTVGSKSGPAEVVITEWRHPPMTMVQRADNLMVGELR